MSEIDWPSTLVTVLAAFGWIVGVGATLRIASRHIDYEGGEPLAFTLAIFFWPAVLACMLGWRIGGRR